MTRNMGGIDRGIRAVVGLGLVTFALATGTWWAAIGVVPLLTALVGTCPAYLPFGWKTCKTQ